MKWKFIASIAFFVALAGCTNIQQPEFRRIEKFRVKNIDLSQGTIGLNVTYYNPNTFGVTVKETEADLYINSVHVGKFTQDSTIGVNKTSEFSIPISGTVPLAELLQLKGNLSNQEVSITADGTTKLGKLGVYVTKPFHYEGNFNPGMIK